MTIDVEVRRATEADAMEMERVHSRSWRATYAGLLPNPVIEHVVSLERRRAGRFSAILVDPSTQAAFFVATREGTVIGLATWAPSGEEDATDATADVQTIYLDPDAIGQGIGRQLLAAVVEDIFARDFTAATLWVLDTNHRARRFYEAAGWRADGSKKDVEVAGAVLHEVRYRRKE
jgi:GNAT superfamily N-acetyltransferase